MNPWKHVLVVVLALTISGAIIFGGELPSTTPAMAEGYSQASLTSFVHAVDGKYDGAVAANDAATIAIGACEEFKKNPGTAYVSFTASSVSAGMSQAQADFMVRTAIEKVCPHHRSDLP